MDNRINEEHLLPGTAIDEQCLPPIRAALQVLGSHQKAALVLALLSMSPQEFNELRRKLDDISANELASILHTFGRDQIVEYKAPPTIYSLTEKGKDFQSILIEMSKWGQKWGKRKNLMANKEPLDQLRDVEQWNQWRLQHPEVLPDLSKANLDHARLRNVNLSKVNLSGANLYDADLSNANLSEANLSRANLSRARLHNVNLSKVNLSGANLYDADLSDANLSNANLSEADLKMAFVCRADLRGANLSKANLDRTLLTQANLSKANLSEVNLTEANLVDANLRGALLEKVLVQETCFQGADLRDIPQELIMELKLQAGADLDFNFTGMLWDHPSSD